MHKSGRISEGNTRADMKRRQERQLPFPKFFSRGILSSSLSIQSPPLLSTTSFPLSTHTRSGSGLRSLAWHVVVVVCPIKGSITCCWGLINKNKNISELSSPATEKPPLDTSRESWRRHTDLPPTATLDDEAGWRDSAGSARLSKEAEKKKNVKTEKIMCYASDIRSNGFGAVLWHLIISHLVSICNSRCCNQFSISQISHLPNRRRRRE